MKLKAVINIFGGPGAGKSTIAAGIFYKMKMQHMDVELVPEYAKELTWEKRTSILGNDQLYVLAKQHRKILRLREEVEYIVVDSPLILGAIYFNEETNLPKWEEFKPLLFSLFHEYPNVNFLLKRSTEAAYDETGRNQTFEEAQEIDDQLSNLLAENRISFVPINTGRAAADSVLSFLETDDVGAEEQPSA